MKKNLLIISMFFFFLKIYGQLPADSAIHIIGNIKYLGNPDTTSVSSQKKISGMKEDNKKTKQSSDNISRDINKKEED